MRHSTLQTKTHPLTEEIEIVQSLPEHHAFIYTTWLKTYGKSRYCLGIKSQDYFSNHRKIITNILESPTTSASVAVDKKYKIILGYLIAEKKADEPVIHFCFTKGAFRRMGVASLLVKSLNLNLNRAVYTHQVERMGWILRKFPGLNFNPYLMRGT